MNKQMKIGLALQGGGLQGFAHIGAIRALDIYSYEDVKKAQEIADISIEVYNSNASLLKVSDIKATIENGYNTVMNNKEEIKEFIADDYGDLPSKRKVIC